MQLRLALRLATASLATSTILFLLAIFFLAKPTYAIYAELFQSGQSYQGETRTALYNHLITTIIAPTSLTLGTMLTIITSKYLKNRSNTKIKKSAPYK
ncbi:hypothetical protein D3C78_697820 [compost metagenome]